MGTIRPQTTLRLAVAAFTVIALLTLSGTLGAFSLQQGSDGSAQQQAWWNSKYGYRQSITVSNPTASPLRSYPVFFTVGFPFTHLSDAAAELRLVSQAGAEVPSYVLDDVSSNGYVTSAWLLAFVSLPGSSLTTFELYYGSPSAATPAYRVDSATAESQAGNLFVATPPTQPGSSSFQVTLGGTYSEQILSKVAYDPGATSGYGAVEISHTAAPVISPLRFVANVSGSVVALSSVYSAGALRYAQALVLDNDTLIIARLLTNTAQTTVSRAAFTDVVDASSLGVLGPIATSYDAASGILSTGVSGAFFGYDSGPAISSFEVGDRGKVIADSRAGALPNSLSEAGTAGALTRDLGSLAPGGSAQLMSSWGFGRTYGQLAASLRQELAQVSLTAGQEEAYTATLPQVTSSWSVQVPITNATISGGGFTVPVSLGAATPIASRFGINLPFSLTY